jgi:hypothetical protein
MNPPGIDPTWLHLQLTMTLGDVIVAASTVSAILICYFGLKQRLEGVTEEMVEIRGTVGEHGTQLAQLDAAVFGRRRNDQQKRSNHR